MAAVANPLNVLLPTIGSSGDVHPVIGLGVALQRRGHKATVITNPFHQALIEQQGLGFLPLGTIDDARRTIANPDLWHPRKGFHVVAREAILPSIEPVFRHIERHADARTVVASSGIALGARLAHEKLGVPLASVHLQPSLIRSRFEQGMMGTIRISASQPMWFKRGLFWLIDRVAIDRVLKGPLNEFRAALGLSPVDRVFDRWLHSPQLVIGFFPEWFAPPQPDWPPQTHLVGFPLWDTGGDRTLPADVEQFLSEGEAPIVFTPGSAAATMHRYFEESVKAVRQLGRRAMFVTNFPEQVPRDLPAGSRVFGYLPFSVLLPRAAMLVYHGGIGTLAQAIKAGIPHLVVPNGHDQFDSGWRIEQLRLGRSLPQSRYRASAVVAAIEKLRADDGLQARCREYSTRIDHDAAITRACELIEGLRRQ
jgi:rhamnosyltransferase subunit B